MKAATSGDEAPNSRERIGQKRKEVKSEAQSRSLLMSIDVNSATTPRSSHTLRGIPPDYGVRLRHMCQITEVPVYSLQPYDVKARFYAILKLPFPWIHKVYAQVEPSDCVYINSATTLTSRNQHLIFKHQSKLNTLRTSLSSYIKVPQSTCLLRIILLLSSPLSIRQRELCSLVSLPSLESRPTR